MVNTVFSILALALAYALWVTFSLLIQFAPWYYRSGSAERLSFSGAKYLSRESSEFDEIWCADTNVDLKNGHVTKYQNFANSKCLMAAILKIVIGYISTIYCPINAKFGMKKQNHTQT